MANRYFYPPDSWPPAFPTFVLIPLSVIFLDMKSYALADLRAATISSSEASGFPYKIFYFMDILNSTGSYPT